MASFSEDELEEIFLFKQQSEAVYRFLVGETGEEYWRKRGGMDGYQRKGNDLSEFKEYSIKKKKELIDTFQGKCPTDKQLYNKIVNFYVYVYSIIYDILRYNESDILSSLLHTHYIKNRKFFFILGAPRTGGHYLLKQLHKSIDINLDDLNPMMTTDAFMGEHIAYFWDNPKFFISFLREFCSFIIWSSMSYSEDSIVIKKSLRLAGAMKAMDYLLKERAAYIVSVRHPQGCFESLLDFYGKVELLGEDWTDRYTKDAVFRDYYLDNSRKLSMEEKFLNYWKNIYYEIIKDGRPYGEIHLLTYGRDIEEFVHNFAKKNNPGFNRDQIEKFKIQKRRNNHKFWNSPVVEETIEQVRSVWKIHGYDFPSIEGLVY